MSFTAPSATIVADRSSSSLLRIGSDATDRALSGEPSGAQMQSLLAELLPALNAAAVERVHLGERPLPGDRLTGAGCLPGVDNAYVAVTHSGVTLGLLLGRLIAGEVTGGEPARLPADFRPHGSTPLNTHDVLMV